MINNATSGGDVGNKRVKGSIVSGARIEGFGGSSRLWCVYWDLAFCLRSCMNKAFDGEWHAIWCRLSYMGRG